MYPLGNCRSKSYDVFDPDELYATTLSGHETWSSQTIECLVVKYKIICGSTFRNTSDPRENLGRNELRFTQYESLVKETSRRPLVCFIPSFPLVRLVRCRLSLLYSSRLYLDECEIFSIYNLCLFSYKLLFALCETIKRTTNCKILFFNE